MAGGKEAGYGLETSHGFHTIHSLFRLVKPNPALTKAPPDIPAGLMIRSNPIKAASSRRLRHHPLGYYYGSSGRLRVPYRCKIRQMDLRR